jgi:hypothetical protein
VSKFKQIANIFLIILIIGSASSCKLQKHLFEIPETPSKALLIVKEVNSAQIPFNNLFLKFSGKLINDESKIGIKGTIKIQKDSLIWISVNPGIGIELARIVLSRDSVKIIDKINSTYYIGDYEYFNRNYKIQIDFFLLQSILLNKYFQYDDTEINSIHKNMIFEETDSNIVCVKIPIDANNQVLASIEGSKILQEIFIDRQLNKITKISIADNFEKKKMNIDYNEFQKVNKLLFPKLINLNISNESNSMDFSLKYSKVVVDKKMRFPFKISKKYKRIY